MKRVVFYIDGFNLFHALDENYNFHKYKWLNLDKLSRCFITSQYTLREVFYFTSYATWNRSKVQKHQLYIKALQTVDVQTILGRFKHQTKRCRLCRQTYSVPTEKQTDVNIAVKLFQDAINDLFDRAIIVSGETI